MNFKIYIRVHVYAEEKLDDRVLVLHNKNYGVCGKETIAPMRKINGHTYVIRNVSDDFTVQDLWDWITFKLYNDNLNMLQGKDIRDTPLYHATEKYLVFNGLRYTIEDAKKSLCDYLKRMNKVEDEEIDVQLLACSEEGEVFRDDGIRYYINSREESRHHIPHIHVDVKHESSGTFSIETGEMLEGNIKREKYLKKIKKTILDKKIELLKFWNEHTDGLSVDLNQYLGIIEY